MKNLIIRNAEPEDLPGCHTVEANCFPAAEAAWTTSIRNRIDEYPEGFLVAELDGEIIAQVNSGSTDKDDITDEEFKQLIGHDPDGRHMVIFSLAVHPNFRRKGIADKLMGEFIVQARDMGKSTIKLLCKDELIPYYSRHGFLDDGLSASEHGGVQWHAMTLHL